MEQDGAENIEGEKATSPEFEKARSSTPQLDDKESEVDQDQKANPGQTKKTRPKSDRDRRHTVRWTPRIAIPKRPQRPRS